MSTLDVVIDEKKLRELVKLYLSSLGVDVDDKDIDIQVMTKNNYRVKEWEQGAFRAKVTKTL